MTAAQAESTAATPPDKPFIAVLSLENISGDPEQEYFSDGVTEDIITEPALALLGWGLRSTVRFRRGGIVNKPITK